MRWCPIKASISLQAYTGKTGLYTDFRNLPPAKNNAYLINALVYCISNIHSIYCEFDKQPAMIKELQRHDCHQQKFINPFVIRFFGEAL